MATQTMHISREADHGEDHDQAEAADRPEINVAMKERMTSLAVGAALVLIGVRRRSTLGALLAIAGGSLLQRGTTGHCGIYAAIGKNTAREQQAPEPSEFHESSVHVEHVVTISKPAAELYSFWRKLDTLPQFMHHLESVKVLDDKRSHWVAAAPAGQHVEWDAEIINDEINKLIAWRSTDNADVHSAGSVKFVEAGERGTEVHVKLDYLPPAGQVGRWIAKLFGEEPDQQVRDDLNRFKQIMENGEAASKANTSRS
jgi:uncharacterized membrane protein